MRELEMLVRPNYVIQRLDGSVQEMYCKGCGEQIAAMIGRNLRYLDNYMEAKLQCDDGSCHVTNGCITCLMKLHGRDMVDFHAADIAASPEGYSENDKRRTPTRVIAIGVAML